MSRIYDLSHINTLDKILEDRDIKQITSAIYPGFHCPLYTALMTALEIEDLAILILGTRECGFYAKTLAVRTHPKKNTLYTLAMDRHEITFGCTDELENAVKSIDAEGRYKALMVITTCVTELTGEDICSVLTGLKKQVSFDILTVQTDHFTKETPVLGLSRTLSALSGLMEKQHKTKPSINILGHRFKDFYSSELAHALKCQGIEIQALIPAKSTVESIRTAPRARLNIVTHFTALPLARTMETSFGLPYVYFNQNLEPEMIRQDYDDIAKALAISATLAPLDVYRRCILASERLKLAVHGKTFVFSTPPMVSFKVCSFLSGQGMIPLWIQTVGLDDTEKGALEKMRAIGVNPRVSRGKNPKVMAFVRDQFQPDFYFAFSPRAHSSISGTRQIPLMQEIGTLGFEQPLRIMEKIYQNL